jgi:hypothetical protein
MSFLVDFAVFFRTIERLYGMVRCAKKLDNNELPTVSESTKYINTFDISARTIFHPIQRYLTGSEFLAELFDESNY